MKISEKFKEDVCKFLVESGSPQPSLEVALHLMPRWKTINVENVLDTCRSFGFPVVGEMIYNLYD